MQEQHRSPHRRSRATNQRLPGTVLPNPFVGEDNSRKSPPPDDFCASWPVGRKINIPVFSDGEQETESRLWQIFYLLLMCGLGVLFLNSLASTENVAVPAKLMAVAILTLTLKRWTGAIILAFAQVMLFYLEPHIAFPSTDAGAIINILITVGLIMSTSRFRSLQDRDHQPIWTSLKHALRHAQSDTPSDVSPGQNFRLFLKQMAKFAVLLTGALLVGSILLAIMPLQSRESTFDSIREFRLFPTAYRAMMLGLLLFLFFLPTWIVVNGLFWRRQTAAQASVYLRSTFLQWCHRDLRMIVRRRIRRRKKLPRVAGNQQADKLDRQPVDGF